MNTPQLLGLQVRVTKLHLWGKEDIWTGVDNWEWLASYKLKNVSHILYTRWKEYISTDASFISWDSFSETFLDRVFLIELRETTVEEFIKLTHESMTLQEYGLKFTNLSMYTPTWLLILGPIWISFFMECETWWR